MRYGSDIHPPNRFERIHVEPDEAHSERHDVDGESGSHRVQLLADHSKSVVTENDSPDIPFRFSLNPYRGCQHGCSYCYARPTHEFLGMSAGLDFETKIIVKNQAVPLLRETLSKPSWKAEPLMLSGVTDPYQPIERKLRITRGLLELLAETNHPLGVITKNALIERDVDLLSKMARHDLVHAAVSITTLDADLARDLEPRTSSPTARLRAIKTLADAGVPTRVMTAPVIPGLNDHEIPQLLGEAAKAGAKFAAYVMLRLPGAVRPVLEHWLEQHQPHKREKILARIRDVRGGSMNDSQFGRRMRGTGVRADTIADLFHACASKYGLKVDSPALRRDLFMPPATSSGQMHLF